MQQLKMQMRAGRLSGGTNQSNRLVPADRLSFRDPQLTAMPVKADKTISVVQLHIVSVTVIRSGFQNNAIRKSMNDGPCICGKICSVMESDLTMDRMHTVSK